MRIGIVGAGAVGLYYGARLAKVGEDVRFLLRSDYEAVRRRGISVKAADGDFCLEKVRAYRSAEEVGVCDLVVVAMKATANAVLPELLRPMVGEETALLTLQNGLGNDAFLAAHFPGRDVFGGLCFVCINRVGAGEVENFHLGSVGLGGLGDTKEGLLEKIGGLLERAGANPRVTGDLLEMQWRKLMWNVPFNGLSIVAGGITTDRILASEALVAEARGLMMEIIAGAAAYGKAIPESFADKQFEITGPMGAYRPSSLVDFLEGKPVEVEAIWGEALRRGEAKGVKMLRLRRLYEGLREVCG